MSELPENWSLVPLLDLSTMIRGVTYTRGDAREQPSEGLIPVLRANNITDAGLSLENLVYVPRRLVSDDQLVRRGDVVIATSSGSINVVGKARQATTDLGAGFGAFCAVLRPSDEVDHRYLGYFLRTGEYRTLVSSLARGVNINNLKRSHFEQIVIPLPPLAEQQRIADKLDALLARVDACRARLGRVPALLKRFRQAVLAAAVEGRLTEDWREEHPELVSASSLVAQIKATHEDAGGHKAGNAAAPTEDVHDLTPEMFPEGWQLADLRELVQPHRPITYGILKPGPELKVGVPYVRVADYPNDRLNLSTIRKTSPAIDKEFSRSKLAPGDLLLSIRGTVGRLIVIPEELEGANITQDSARLSLQLYVNRDYILWFLRSELAQQRMKGAVKGVAVRGINIGDVRALQVAIPSLPEQDEIVRRIEAIFAYADRLETRTEAVYTGVEQLTPSLLAKAFRGELVPQDPDDEPAQILLERIKNDRSLMPTEKKTAARKRANMSAKSSKSQPASTPEELVQALKDADRELSSSELLLAAGFPVNAEAETVEDFLVLLRETLRSNAIARRRIENTDWFSLAEENERHQLRED